MMQRNVRSPCVGVCSTGVSDNVCRGCKRYAHEVINWNRYTREQRQAVISRLENLLTTVLENYLQPVDFIIIDRRLSEMNLENPFPQNSYSALYGLLRAGASKIASTEDYGFIIVPEKSHLDLVEIKVLIERDYYALSEAHYHRYFDIEYVAPVEHTVSVRT